MILTIVPLPVGGRLTNVLQGLCHPSRNLPQALVVRVATIYQQGVIPGKQNIGLSVWHSK